MDTFKVWKKWTSKNVFWKGFRREVKGFRVFFWDGYRYVSFRRKIWEVVFRGCFEVGYGVEFLELVRESFFGFEIVEDGRRSWRGAID